MEKKFFRIWYHLIRILQQICHFYPIWKKGVFKKNPFFSKKTETSNAFEKPYYFSRIYVIFAVLMIKKLEFKVGHFVRTLSIVK